MPILATDLDRTLFPNGKQPADDSMPLLKQALEHSGMQLIYVTGRNQNQIREGVEQYDPPQPGYAVAEVGTKVYRCDRGEFIEETGYVQRVRELTPGWSTAAFRSALEDCPQVRLQEAFNQNEFKASYYVDDPAQGRDAVAAVRGIIEPLCANVNIVYSVDETIGIGLLDILPQRANKMEGLEFLREQLGVEKEEIIYAGDSGNDLIPLTFGYRSILVANATEEVRREVEEVANERGTLDRIYFAQGTDGLNGNYHSGVLEGLRHFGAVA
jgi:HAD superfamily hydrolase (TIGR01484 family)